MASRVLKDLPSAQAVAAGQNAIITLPLGLSYHAIFIRYRRDDGGAVDATAAHFASDFEEVQVIVDGEPKWRLSGAQLLALNTYYGIDFQPGVLPIYFARPWQRLPLGEDELAYGTADVQSFSLEVKLATGAAPVLFEATAVMGQQAKLGRHATVKKFNYNFGAVGVHEIPDLPKGPYGLIAMHIANGGVVDAEIQANQRVVWEADAALQTAYLKTYGRVPQAGFHHIDIQANNRVSEVLPLNLQDFRAKINFGTAPGAYDLLMEQIEKRA